MSDDDDLESLFGSDEEVELGHDESPLNSEEEEELQNAFRALDAPKEDSLGGEDTFDEDMHNEFVRGYSDDSNTVLTHGQQKQRPLEETLKAAGNAVTAVNASNLLRDIGKDISTAKHASQQKAAAVTTKNLGDAVRQQDASDKRRGVVTRINGPNSSFQYEITKEDEKAILGKGTKEALQVLIQKYPEQKAKYDEILRRLEKYYTNRFTWANPQEKWNAVMKHRGGRSRKNKKQKQKWVSSRRKRNKTNKSQKGRRNGKGKSKRRR